MKAPTQIVDANKLKRRVDATRSTKSDMCWLKKETSNASTFLLRRGAAASGKTIVNILRPPKKLSSTLSDAGKVFSDARALAADCRRQLAKLTTLESALTKRGATRRLRQRSKTAKKRNASHRFFFVLHSAAKHAEARARARPRTKNRLSPLSIIVVAAIIALRSPKS